MRVITPFGLGELEIEEWEPPIVRVNLDKPFLEKHALFLDKISEVFCLSNFAAVRVLNISGSGWFSNLQFHDCPSDARKLLFKNYSPPDETTFYLDLKNGSVEVNRELGFAAQKMLWINPWLDRWAIEKAIHSSDYSSTLKLFKEEKEKTAGTTGGIRGSVLLDIENKKILWCYLFIATGVVWEKKFI